MKNSIPFIKIFFEATVTFDISIPLYNFCMFVGWYHGERIRDGTTGWFPSNYTIEIVNPHVRARNLKQRYRLLTFSENYLKS